MAAVLQCVAAAGIAHFLPTHPRINAQTPPTQHTAHIKMLDQDYVPQTHEWESKPNPIFNYPEEQPWIADGAKAIRKHANEVLPAFQALKNKNFFRFYAVDLLASCGYTPSTEIPCALDACEIEPTDLAPDTMVARDEDEYEFELDSWARWDMPSDFTEYYDLVEYVEKNTGYDGSRVWRFIHQKICFQKDLHEEWALYKRDFNRAVSGLHSCVAANIIRDVRESEGDDAAAKEYARRLAGVPGAVSNLFFAYMLLLCALDEMRPRLEKCNYLGEVSEVRPFMEQLLSSPLLRHGAVQRAAEGLRAHAQCSEAAPWKMRLRTRDLLGVMNCVQCNLCRLHGKVMVLGFAASLQLLLGNKGRGEGGCDEEPDPYSLSRVEVAALVTTAGKLASACELVEQMEAIVEPTIESGEMRARLEAF